MKATGSRTGLVLQGYFGIEQFRAAGRRTMEALPMRSMAPQSIIERAVAQMRATAAQAKPASSVPGAPRPDLMPAKMRAIVGQARQARPSGARSGAPRSELLPGMGLPRIGDRTRLVVQPRASLGISTTLIPPGGLRTIGDGRPLEPWIRQAMEGFFQADFSAVRIHEGQAAQSMGALAFTLGDELHFAPGLYDPTSRDGVALLGHELTHVVQQREGRVANRYGRGVAIVQDPALEAEADRMGQKVAQQIYAGSRVAQAMQERGRPQERSQNHTQRRRSPKAQSERFGRLFLPKSQEENYPRVFEDVPEKSKKNWMSKKSTITRSPTTCCFTSCMPCTSTGEPI